MAEKDKKKTFRSRGPKFLMVRDFEKTQHYKYRNPPWIKLHNSHLQDPAFLRLDEISQGRFFKCLFIASSNNNRIENDPKLLRKLMRVDVDVDLTPLIKKGLLLAWRKQNAPSEKSREEKSKEEQSRVEIEPEIKKSKTDVTKQESVSHTVNGRKKVAGGFQKVGDSPGLKFCQSRALELEEEEKARRTNEHQETD